MAIKQPKDIEFHAVYEPDMSRMVKALQILLDWKPAKVNDHGETSHNIRKAHNRPNKRNGLGIPDQKANTWGS